MTLKTNQFNFKTLRLSESEIKEKIKNSEFIFMVSLKDVYGINKDIAKSVEGQAIFEKQILNDMKKLQKSSKCKVFVYGY